MKRPGFYIFFILSMGLVSGQENHHPFGSNPAYGKNCIIPSRWNRETLNRITSNFYEQWKEVHLKKVKNQKDQYYVFDNEGKDPQISSKSICVSEGQGYGMLIMAYMAGYDSDSRKYFDGMFRFCRAHPSSNSPYLMSWSVNKDFKDNINKEEDHSSSATDGDLDIAFSLLLADVQWGSSGSVNYREEALKMIHAIREMEVNKELFTLKLCDDFKKNEVENNDMRTSDFMPDHLRAFYDYTHDSIWFKIITHTYTVFQDIQNHYSLKTGLLPDFIQYSKGVYRPAHANYLESDNDGYYYYNACRVPLRLAVDYLLNNESQAKNILLKINTWVEKKSKNDPDAIWSGYKLNGSDIKQNDYTTPAFEAPLTVSLMVDPASQEWLNDMFSSLIQNKFKDYKYFDNTINLLSLLVLSGNYWAPGSINQ